MVPVVTIVGRSKSGKTSILEKLIAEFKNRGYRVAAIKHAHDTVDLDIQGKDTWRLTKAGSDATAICSPSIMTIFKRTSDDPTLEEAVTKLGNEYDIILSEGFKSGRYAKIEVIGDRDDDSILCNPSELMAVISDKDIELPVPIFKKTDIAKVTDFIIENVIDRSSPDITVIVNEKQVFMKPFVKNIIANSILAMLGTLRNTGILQRVSIYINNVRQRNEHWEADRHA